ncbi:MAG: YfhO family protein, partial [Gemmatimonadales bacterium]
ATVAEWRPGKMRVTIAGDAAQEEYLLISENWYPDWKATIDGTQVPVHRANNTMLSVVLPAGAREVVFEFDSPSYRRGRAISLASLFGIAAIFAGSVVRRRRVRDG